MPLTELPDLDPELGTRHRAAIGITENTDAICVVISEETGTISLANHGHLVRGLNESKLALFLAALLQSPSGTMGGGRNGSGGGAGEGAEEGGAASRAADGTGAAPAAAPGPGAPVAAGTARFSTGIWRLPGHLWQQLAQAWQQALRFGR